MIIGITGRSGVGKSSLSKLLQKFGNNFMYVNFDELGHQILDDYEVQEQIKRSLGVEVTSSTNRKALAEKIFCDRSKMKVLSDIMYDRMKVEVNAILKTYENVILDWILLPHTSYFRLCDIKILVKPKTDNIRKEKVMKRDGLTEIELAMRDSASIKYNENDFDFVIKNNYSLDNTNKNLYNLI